MRPTEFSIIAALLFGTALAVTMEGHENHGNCTTEDKDKFKEKCSKENLEILKPDTVKVYETVEIGQDPFSLWDDDTPCSQSKELSMYLKCFFENVEDCHANMSMSDDLPNPQNVKEAVQRFCEQKAKVMESENATVLAACIPAQKKEVNICFDKAVKDDESLVSDPCLASEQFTTCMSKMTECTKIPMFETWAKYMVPDHCNGACTLSLTMIVMLLATLMATVFN